MGVPSAGVAEDLTEIDDSGKSEVTLIRAMSARRVFGFHEHGVTPVAYTPAQVEDAEVDKTCQNAHGQVRRRKGRSA